MAILFFIVTRIYARTRVLRGCDEKDFMSARVGAIVFPNPYTVYPDSPSARFIFFWFFGFCALEKRKKKAKSRKEKKNRGDKVLKT